MIRPRIAIIAVAAVVLLIAIFFIAGRSDIKPKHAAAAERIMGLKFNAAERDSLMGGLRNNRENYEGLRELVLTNDIPPAFVFNPVPQGKLFSTETQPPVFSPVITPERPDEMDDLAYLSIAELGSMLKNRVITSTELTKMYLGRLKHFGPQLEAVVTLTEKLALEQAARADKEIAAGNYRGPLHGIPYGAKDLLAAKTYNTTWGAAPYKDQMIDEDATVVRKLEEAGAVLVAKLTLGALAWGDVWFGGKTRNPWNLEQGSSGSSAGPGAATAAGLVAFAIGSETWGSIVSPATRNGVTGLRPTFGRVSRAGAMALSWTMDKLGPMCRTVEDCAIVLEAIRGTDGLDQTVVDLPFNYNYEVDLSKLRIGYVESAFERDYDNKANDQAVLDKLRELGAKLVPMALPDYDYGIMSFILNAEAAAAFDDLTRSNRDDELVRQIKNAWPNAFRTARFIPAVEYIQANRLRYKIIQEMEAILEDYDLYIAPSFGGGNLLLTNLTGHPCVVLPNGFNDRGSPTSITFMGKLYDEATLLAVARAYQQATDWHKQHPPLFP